MLWRSYLLPITEILFDFVWSLLKYLSTIPYLVNVFRLFTLKLYSKELIIYKFTRSLVSGVVAIETQLFFWGGGMYYIMYYKNVNSNNRQYFFNLTNK